MTNQKNSQKNSSLASFSLMELLVVISFIIIIAIVALITLNPKKQIEKSSDAKRKQELTLLQKSFEDYYNDKNCYPSPQDVCYNSPTQLQDGSYTCNICGNESLSPSFSPYLSRLPCDPNHPNKKYLYQTDSLNCPTLYRIYTKISSADPAVSQVGCSYGCGPINSQTSYNYGVTSPNTSLQQQSENLYYCSQIGNCTRLIQDQPGKKKVCNPSYLDPNCSNSNCQQISKCHYENL